METLKLKFRNRSNSMKDRAKPCLYRDRHQRHSPGNDVKVSITQCNHELLPAVIMADYYRRRALRYFLQIYLFSFIADVFETLRSFHETCKS